jgi:glutamate-1-semialdehyde 2,1-aminomutase
MLTRAAGALLIIDEAHTQIAAYGGFTRQWSLSPDILTLGKSLGGGIALGAYGVSQELQALIEKNSEPLVEYEETIALGGTTYGSALAMAAPRATLTDVLTELAYDRILELSTRLADGIDAVLDQHALPWRAQRLGNRSGVFLSRAQPRNASEALAALSKPLNLAQRAFMANRGIWEPIYIHGPSLSFAHDEDEVAAYLEAFAEWIGVLTKEAVA